MKRTLRAQADFQTTVLRNQLTSLVLFESITTTKANALMLIPFANHFFNRVKIADLTAKRLAHQTFFDQNAAKKMFEEILPRYQKTETTFVRSFRVVGRKGDNAPQMMVSLIHPLSAKAPAKAVEKDSTDTKKAVTKKKAATGAKKWLSNEPPTSLTPQAKPSVA